MTKAPIVILVTEEPAHGSVAAISSKLHAEHTILIKARAISELTKLTLPPPIKPLYKPIPIPKAKFFSRKHLKFKRRR